jgi:hypothetical protein
VRAYDSHGFVAERGAAVTGLPLRLGFGALDPRDLRVAAVGRGVVATAPAAASTVTARWPSS